MKLFIDLQTTKTLEIQSARYSVDRDRWQIIYSLGTTRCTHDSKSSLLEGALKEVAEIARSQTPTNK